MKKPPKLSRLQALRMRREQIEQEVAGPLIAERDRATGWARSAEVRRQQEEKRREMAERLFATDIGKHASTEMQHWIAKEIGQHAMRAAVATVNETMETGDYVIRIRVPELNIQRHFARRDVLDAPMRRGVAPTEATTIREVSINTKQLRR